MNKELKDLFNKQLRIDTEIRRKYLDGIDEIKRDYEKRRNEVLANASRIVADVDINEVLNKYGRREIVRIWGTEGFINPSFRDAYFLGITALYPLMDRQFQYTNQIGEAFGFLDALSGSPDYGFFGIKDARLSLSEAEMNKHSNHTYFKIELSEWFPIEPTIPGYDPYSKDFRVPPLPKMDEIRPILPRPEELTARIENEIRKLLG